ncbi:hypothetical protein OIV83_000272 [Microbotryomycetes sp. JL201]|nr:hypothetical protein OIV83_000272 [Microbotryomycetes sp. JL201]
MSAASGSTDSLKYGSAKKRVNTTPTWVRKLPPDEMELRFNQQQTVHNREPHPPASRGLMNELEPGSTVDAEAAKTRPTGTATPPGRCPSDSAPTSPDSRLTGPTLLQPAHSRDDVQRSLNSRSAAAGAPSNNATDSWWTFTLPQKYLDRVHDYINGQQQDQSKNSGTDDTDEKQQRRRRRRRDSIDSSHSRRSNTSSRSLASSFRRNNRHPDVEKQDDHGNGRSMSMSARLAPPGVFSMNHAQTPGWSSPWTPFHRDGHEGGDDRDPFTIAQANAEQNKSRMSRFERFILRSAFAPLVFRFINLVVTTCTLGLAADIRERERKAKLVGIMGSSTIMCIVVAPIAIAHIFVTLYIEYFGSPIGIWSLGSKMAHTLTELIFICLWSSVLSLSFDDLFTSALECTAYTPYAQYNEPPTNVTGTAQMEGSLADKVCAQQSAVVAFVFIQVFLYAGILIVSLFRIFHKVSRK